jgi:hypothetical protein
MKSSQELCVITELNCTVEAVVGSYSVLFTALHIDEDSAS